jgi:hypothetical protein
MKSVRHALCTGEKRNANSFWWGNLNDRDYSEEQFKYYPPIDGRILLKFIIQKYIHTTG